MKAAIKQEWVRRLRSGDYEQGQCHLNYDGKFCCLGVLMEMAVEAGICERLTAYYTSNVRYADISVDYIPMFTEGADDGLTIGAFKWSGLKLLDSPILIQLNDEAHESFHSIADYIERRIGDDTE